MHDAVQRDLEQLRDSVSRAVGSVFYGTLLKAMRESRLTGSYGHGGRGEEVFASQLHGILAERAGTVTRTGLAKALLHRLEGQQRLVSGQAAGKRKAET